MDAKRRPLSRPQPIWLWAAQSESEAKYSRDLLIPPYDEQISGKRAYAITTPVCIDAAGCPAYKPPQLSAACASGWTANFWLWRRMHGGTPSRRRNIRETDLSTEQAGAQAPSWLPCPHGHHGGPQGRGGAARARTEKAQRLSRGTRPFGLHGAVAAAGGFSGCQEWHQGVGLRFRVTGAQAG